MREAVIVASSRTPLAKSFRGSFKDIRPDDMAAHCIADVLSKVPALSPSEIGDVILGCAYPSGKQGSNVARVAAFRAGLPATIPGTTVNRFCSSGLQAIVMAAHQIVLEGVEAAIGGGVESITMLNRDSDPNPAVLAARPALYMAMGDTAEVVAKRYKSAASSRMSMPCRASSGQRPHRPRGCSMKRSRRSKGLRGMSAIVQTLRSKACWH